MPLLRSFRIFSTSGFSWRNSNRKKRVDLKRLFYHSCTSEKGVWNGNRLLGIMTFSGITQVCVRKAASNGSEGVSAHVFATSSSSPEFPVEERGGCPAKKRRWRRSDKFVKSVLPAQQNHGEDGGNGSNSVDAGTDSIRKKTGLIDQYKQLAMQYPDYLLLLQVGEFFEIYGQPAQDVSQKVNLRLCKINDTDSVGFPVWATENWFKTLLGAGYKLAIGREIRSVDPENDQRPR